MSKRVCGLNPDNQQPTQKKPTPVLAHHPEKLWEPALLAIYRQRQDALRLLGLAAKVHGVDGAAKLARKPRLLEVLGQTAVNPDGTKAPISKGASPLPR